MDDNKLSEMIDAVRKEAEAIKSIAKEYESPELPYTIADGYTTDPPMRGSECSAGLDVFVPRLSPPFAKAFKERNPNISIAGGIFVVPPHERIIIPTGLKFNIPPGTYLEVANRGSVAAKQGLIFGAHIIDQDYVGIVFINLINTSLVPVTIRSGDKLAQLIHKEYIPSTLKYVPEDQIRETNRGDGALGSTGK